MWIPETATSHAFWRASRLQEHGGGHIVGAVVQQREHTMRVNVYNEELTDRVEPATDVANSVSGLPNGRAESSAVLRLSLSQPRQRSYVGFWWTRALAGRDWVADYFSTPSPFPGN